MRGAFTLVEVLVALVLLQVGMLALVAGSAVAARDLATANRRAKALMLARNRIELLRVSACSHSGAGQARAADGSTEAWRVEANGLRRSVIQSVEYPLPGGRRDSVVLRATVLCVS